MPYRRAAPPCRHLDTVELFSSPRPPRLGSARRAPTSRRAWNHLTTDEMCTACRAASRVARDLLGSPTDEGSRAPSAVPPPDGAHGTG
jgi:hypothetical protein